MTKLTRAAALMALFAFSAVAQEAAPTAPLSHRGTFLADLTSQPKPLTVTVPAETEVNVEVLSGIHTQINRVNDPVIAKVLAPVSVKGRIALPTGSLLDGRITMIRNSGHMHRPAELGLRFDRITLPDGQEKPIAAVLAALENPAALDFHLDAEGHLTGNRAISVKGVFGGFAALGTYGALKMAAVGSSGVSLVLPLGGAALIGYEAFWRRGREVNVPPDTHCRLRLNYPLTVRIPW
ncbi:MAG: hypothetical protein ABSA41_07020 [Terriglobia bacterium]|jgi:hypothetical protein